MTLTYNAPTEVGSKHGPRIRRVICENPSPLTGFGTNSYILGDTQLAVIDPGPMDTAHLAALLDCIEAHQSVTHIFVTHAHLDHSPLARPLAQKTGAPIYAYGSIDTGRSAIMTQLAQHADLQGGEGRDEDFAPDVTLSDGQTLKTPDWTLTAHWTPGHLSNHMSFAVHDIEFSGDLVMGWASSLVSPPDGDLTQFMASCRAMRARAPQRLLAGHGDIVDPATDRIDWLIAHRLDREAQILAALDAGAATPADITAAVYTDVPAHLWPAAQRNVLSHLIDLTQRQRLTHDAPLTPTSVFRKV